MVLGRYLTFWYLEPRVGERIKQPRFPEDLADTHEMRPLLFCFGHRAHGLWIDGVCTRSRVKEAYSKSCIASLAHQLRDTRLNCKMRM